MSFSTKARKGKKYVYFRAGREGMYYLGPEDSQSAIKFANVEKSLRYMQKRVKHDRKTVEKLLSLLPQDKKEQYSALFD